MSSLPKRVGVPIARPIAVSMGSSVGGGTIAGALGEAEEDVSVEDARREAAVERTSRTAGRFDLGDHAYPELDGEEEEAGGSGGSRKYLVGGDEEEGAGDDDGGRAWLGGAGGAGADGEGVSAASAAAAAAGVAAPAASLPASRIAGPDASAAPAGAAGARAPFDPSRLSDPSLPVCLIITGMAGSGKTTLLQRLNAEAHMRQEPSYIVNLDPAVAHVPYGPNIDIRDTVNYKEVMKQYGLGPNGGIVTALNLFATRFDQVVSLLETRMPTLK